MTLGRVLADGWARLRSDAGLILGIAGATLFWPMWAVLLVVPKPPPMPAEWFDEAAVAAWQRAVLAWGAGNAAWYVAAEAIAILGLGALGALLADPARPTVAEAFGSAARRFGRLLLASIALSLVIGIGLRLLILPGLYLTARLAAAVPALMRRPGRGARQALVESWRLTGHGQFALFGAVVTLFLAQVLIAGMLLPLDEWLRQPGNGNPIVLALADAGIALALSGYRAGVLVLGVGALRDR